MGGYELKNCAKCNIQINTDKKQCPICFNELEGKNDADYTPNFSSKNYDRSTQKGFFVFKLFLFFTICSSGIVLFINLVTNPKVLWSIVVIISLLYVWILVLHTIISRRNFFEKILFQLVGVYAIVLSTNLITLDFSWIWSYFVASVSLLTITVLAFIIFINKKREDYIASAFIISLLLLATSIVLIATKVDLFRILNLINIMYNAIFLLGILFFGHKILINAFQKNLHV